MAGTRVRVLRVYDDPGREPGEYRALVDRLWPRGRRKEDVDFDEWAKDAAPTTELRRWYAHEPSRFPEFERRYRKELAGEPALSALARLREVAARQPLVLLTATADVERSGAAVLARVVEAGGVRQAHILDKVD